MEQKEKSSKLVTDIKECIEDLKREFTESQLPITDDCPSLHKFSAKFEYIMQSKMKEKSSFLGGKKDYWDYMCDCLGKKKGMNDGIRFVKSLNEVRTSLGKGRALVRYSLVHQRLADTLQQCTMNGKVSSDWYYPDSLLLNYSQSSMLVTHLYDLNDVQFDLMPTGYDLDAAWPTFARKSFGRPALHLWSPGTNSSFSSLSSIPSQFSEASSPKKELKETVDEDIYNDLRLEYDQMELKNQEQLNRIKEMEGERDSAQKMSQEAEENIKTLRTNISECEDRIKDLTAEVQSKDRTAIDREKEYEKQLEEMRKSSAMLQTNFDKLSEQLESKDRAFAKSEANLRENLLAAETDGAQLKLEVKSLNNEIEIAKISRGKMEEMNSLLETKVTSLEAKNIELITSMENMVKDKDSKASTHFDSANKVHELLSKLTEAEKLNIELKGNGKELGWKVENLQESLLEKTSSLESLKKEKENLEKSLQEQTNQFVDSESSWKKRQHDFEQSVSELRGETENLRESIASKEKEIAELNSCSQELRERVKTLENHKVEQAAMAETRIQELATAETELHKHVEEVEAQVRSLQGQNSELAAKCQEVQGRADGLEVNNFELQAKLSGLEELNTTMLGTIHDLTDSLSSHQHQKGEVQAELSHLKSAISHLGSPEFDQTQFDESQMPWNDTSSVDQSKDLLNKLQSFIAEKQLLLCKLQASETQNLELMALNGKAQQELVEGQDELKECRRQLEESRTGAIQLEHELDGLKERESAARSQLTDRQSRIDQVQRQLAESEARAGETAALLAGVQAAVTAKEEMAVQMSGTRNELEQDIVKLNKELDNSKRQSLEYEQGVKRGEERAAELEGTIAGLVSRGEELEAEVNRLKEDREKEGSRSREVQAELEAEVSRLKEELEKERSRSQEVRAELEARIVEVAGSQRAEFEAKRDRLQQEHEDKMEFLRQQYHALETRVEEEKQGAGVELTKKSQEQQTLREELDMVQKERNEIKEKNDQLNVKITELDELYLLVLGEKEEVQSKLQASVTEASDKLAEMGHLRQQLQKELDTLRSQRNQASDALDDQRGISMEREESIARLELRVAQLMEEAAMLRTTAENETLALKRQMETEAVKHQQKVKDYEALEKDLLAWQDRSGQSEARADEVSGELEVVRRQLGQKVEEMDQLTSDSKELKKKLIKLIREKDSLWQETDKLFYQQKVRASERWLSDSEVAKCMKCATEFSLILRRHHCRLCGRIFCNSCSNNWVMTSHSSKKARVCDSCHSEHGALEEEEKLISSLLDAESDDERQSESYLFSRQTSVATDSVSNDLANHSPPASTETLNNITTTASVHCVDDKAANSRRDSGPSNHSPASMETPNSITTTASVHHVNEAANSTRDSGSTNHSPVSTETPISLAAAANSDAVNNSMGDTNHSGQGDLNISQDNKDSGVVDQPEPEDLPRSEADRSPNEDGLNRSTEETYDIITSEDVEGFKESLSSSSGVTDVQDLSLTTSLTLSAEELDDGDDSVEVWIRATKAYAVPVLVQAPGTVLCWQFSSEPKSIAFSVTFRASDEADGQPQVIVPLVRCNSHKEVMQGELTTKQPGIYTLIFDNSFSRFKSKKVVYKLYVKQSETGLD